MSDERWQFMLPLWQVLQDHSVALAIVPSIDTSLLCSGGGGLILEPSSKLSDPRQMERVVGAIELVYLQSLVEHRSFAEMARRLLVRRQRPLLGRKAGDVVHPGSAIPCVLIVDLTAASNRDDGEGDKLQVLTALARVVPLVQHLEAYEPTRERLCAMLSQGARRQVQSGGFIRCQLVLPLDATTAQALAILTATRSARQGAASFDVDIAVDARSAAVAHVAQLRDAMASGVITVHNKSLVIDDYDQDNAVITEQAVATLLPVRWALLPSVPASSRNEPVVGAQGERSLTVTVSNNPVMFARLFSSLMVTREVDSLRLKLLTRQPFHHEFHGRVFCWLLHALFSSSGANSIRHVRLPPWWFEANSTSMRYHVYSRNRAPWLYVDSVWGEIDMDEESRLAPKLVDVAQGTALLLQPDRTAAREMPRLPRTMSLEVLHEEADNVHVIVPGYGHCRVPRAAILSETVVETPRDYDMHGIESLTVVGPRDCVNYNNGLSEFLMIVGRPLKQFTIKNHTHHTTGVLQELWDHCPQLERLLVYRCRHVDLQWAILRAYESGKCRVKSLGFNRVHFYKIDEILEFLATLGTPGTAIHDTLEELTLRYLQPGDGTIEDVVAAVKHMLLYNTQLRYFAVAIPDASAMSLMAFHNLALPALRTPLRLCCKLAFLSVVDIACSDRGDGKRRPRPPAAMSRLDQSVLSLIMSMAAVSVCRQVEVITEGPEFADAPPASGYEYEGTYVQPPLPDDDDDL